MERIEVHQKLRKLCLDMKSQAPEDLEYDISKITSDYIKEHNIKRAIIGLNTKGCSYAKETGGCFICGYLPNHTKKSNTVEQVLKDFKIYKDSPVIYVYSNGSFLDEEEISKEEQDEILKVLANSQTVRKIVFETRPDFIKEERIKEILTITKNKSLEIRLGFDTYDDEIRDICLGKGFTRGTYNKATEILRKHSVIFGSYIVIKPPFLTESEGIEEGKKSVKYAFKKGSSFVSLEPIAIQRYTLQNYLKEKGLYRVPWLWSVIDIVKSTHYLGKILVGGDAFIPLPIEEAHNCNKCTEEVRKRINNYNLNANLSIFEGLSCDCIDKWKIDLRKKEEALYKKIKRSLMM